MTADADFAASQGRTIVTFRKPEVTDPPDPEAPVYEGVVSAPAENGVDDPLRPVLALFSDNTAAPARDSPFEPTNPNDPVSPQRVSQSTGAVPYPPGVLATFPDDPALHPGGPAPSPEPPPVTSGEVTGFAADATGVVTVNAELAAVLVAGTSSLTLAAVAGDPAAMAVIDGQTYAVSAVNGTSVTLTGLDLTGHDVTDLAATGTVA
jgi:hypothetical protein